MTAITKGYTESLLEQTIALPSFLHPLFIDEDQRKLTTQMGELAIEMKTIRGITQNLSYRTSKLDNITIPIKKQIKLKQAIKDAQRLTNDIAIKSTSVNWGSFSANWKAKKLAKYAKQSARHITQIQNHLTPYISDTPHEETLLILDDQDLMKQIKVAMSKNSKTYIPQKDEINEILAV